MKDNINLFGDEFGRIIAECKNEEEHLRVMETKYAMAALKLK